jgi:hypothetical protein
MDTRSSLLFENLTLAGSVKRAESYPVGDGTALLNRGSFEGHRKQPPKK